VEELKISRWDATDYLKTHEKIKSYLEITFEHGEIFDITGALCTAAKAKYRVENENNVTDGKIEYPEFKENENMTVMEFINAINELGYKLTLAPKSAHNIYETEENENDGKIITPEVA